MVILALETATRAGSLALVTDRGPEAAMTGDPQHTHGVRLPGEITQFLQRAGRTLADVDVFAVVTGPGSFTGLRVGLATIQGLALAQGRPVIAVPTLEALASGWLEAQTVPAAPPRNDQSGALALCLDAARGDVFYSAYDITGADRFEAARLLIEPRVAPPAAAAADLAGACGATRITIVGDGGERYAQAFGAGLPQAIIRSPMPNLAAAAASLAARRLDRAEPPHDLRPIYVRRPDAELARDRPGRAQPAPSATSDDPAPSGAGHKEDTGDPGTFAVIEVTRPDDLANVVALQRHAFGASWPEESLAGGRAGGHLTRLFAARRPAGEIIAYCAAWQILDELHINSLAVDERFRRHGVARALLQRVLSSVAAGGVKSATLEVRASNDAGKALYEKLGFRVEGVRPRYYENPPEDALVLWRRDLSDNFA